MLAAALFDKPAFQNVICSGWIVAADGQKLSKRKKNYAPMDEVFDQYGVDTMRFFMSFSPLMNGEDTRFSVDYLRDVQRNVFMTLNNVFSFYKLYADVDGWKPDKPLQEPSGNNVLDKWILARLNQAITEVTKGMEVYRLDKASRPIADLLDDISNWYVRRSRRRFWRPARRSLGEGGKTEDDTDKNEAYATLHYVIFRTCQLLAPFSPFLPDYIWRQMVQDTSLPESVHLSDWPLVRRSLDEGVSVSEPDKASHILLENMQLVRELITEGLAQRAAAGIKVRQPLAAASIVLHSDQRENYKDLIREELNVKEVKWAATGQSIVMDTELTDELKLEGIARELIRAIQNARKNAGFNVENRIETAVSSQSNEIMEALERFKTIIDAETLTVASLEQPSTAEHTETVTVQAQEVTISLKRIEGRG